MRHADSARREIGMLGEQSFDSITWQQQIARQLDAKAEYTSCELLPRS